MNIPLTVLIEARECLAIAEKHVATPDFMRIVKAHIELKLCLQKALAAQQVEVTA